MILIIHFKSEICHDLKKKKPREHYRTLMIEDNQQSKIERKID